MAKGEQHRVLYLLECISYICTDKSKFYGHLF